MDGAHPVGVVKHLACETEPQVCHDRTFCCVLAFKGHDFEGVGPDVMFAASHRVMLFYGGEQWRYVDFPHGDGFVQGGVMFLGNIFRVLLDFDGVASGDCSALASHLFDSGGGDSNGF